MNCQCDFCISYVLSYRGLHDPHLKPIQAVTDQRNVQERFSAAHRRTAAALYVSAGRVMSKDNSRNYSSLNYYTRNSVIQEMSMHNDMYKDFGV